MMGSLSTRAKIEPLPAGSFDVNISRKPIRSSPRRQGGSDQLPEPGPRRVGEERLQRMALLHVPFFQRFVHLTRTAVCATSAGGCRIRGGLVWLWKLYGPERDRRRGSRASSNSDSGLAYCQQIARHRAELPPVKPHTAGESIKY